MQKPFVLANLGLLFFSSFALVQSSAQAPPTQPAAGQLTPQMLGEMLRSATTFNDLVRSLNLNKTFGPDQHVQGPDGRLRHPVERTAQTIGAGVGAGAAVGAMTHNQNGVLIGALVGGMGGLIVDQVLKHREELREKAAQQPPPDPRYDPNDRSLRFKEREPEIRR